MDEQTRTEQTRSVAARLASLGHESRLSVFQVLVQAGHAGLTIGEIQLALDIPASTLAFHLRELVQTQLVLQEKDGRTVRCRAHFAALHEIVGFLQRNCCAGVPTRVADGAAPLSAACA